MRIYGWSTEDGPTINSEDPWQNVKNEYQRAYLANAYRVLLTRARQGMIIYVPNGDPGDPTREPSYYDGVVRFLEACGLDNAS